MRILLALLSTLTFLATASMAEEPIRLPVTKDNSIVMVDGEWDLNAGQQGRIRIKGNQHMVAMAFDMSAMAGKRVKKATLVCEKGEQDISGVSISTIATLWDEHRSNGLSAGMDDVEDWGYRGARFPVVCGGNGFTLVHQANSVVRDGKYHWDVPPDMIHAMAIGVAHGLAIHDHDSDTGRNPTIFAREQSGKKPYLIVEVDDQNEAKAEAATDLRLDSSDGLSAWLILTSPRHGFAYEVSVGGKLLGRHNIPLVCNGQEQTIPLRDLPRSIAADQPYEIKVVTLNRTGQPSQPVVLRSVILKSNAIERPAMSIVPQHKSPVAGLSVIPITDKYDVSGNAVGDLPPDYRTHNSIFDGHTVRLTAAAGEVVGFQLLLRSHQKKHEKVSVNVQLDELTSRIDLHQAVYVPTKAEAGGRLIPDPLLPMPDSILLESDADRSIVADIYIPFDAVAGLRTGKITISDGRIVP